MITSRTDGTSVSTFEPGSTALRARELVVIVDDQSTGRRVLAQVIRGIGAEIEVVCFQDASAAIEFIRSRTPDLILTDYLMPGMNGVSFIRRVRKLPGLAEVPIIVVTVVDDRHVLYRALEAGATDFLNRPIDEHECRARCRNLLTLRRQHQIIHLRARQLEARGEQLARLTSQLTLTEQRARRRIAKTVQDDLQQLLVGAAFGVERISRGLGGSGAASGVQSALQDVGDGLKQAINVARGLVDDLTPLILHEVGLPEALQSLARRMREHSGLTVQVTSDAALPPIREDLRILVFEEVREALLNTARHARCAEAAVVASRSDDGCLEIRVEDAGVGFDINRIADGSERQGGYGLLSMRERLRALGGSADIDSAPGRGTRVLLRAPLACASISQMPDAGAADLSSAWPEPPADALIDRVRILLVDDHTMVRRALASTLEDVEGLRIVGEAADGLEAVRQVELLQPDVVLMDFAMPRLDGLEATRRIKARWPGVQVIGLSMYDEADRAEAMIAAGARAYLSKTGDIDALLAVIREGGTGASAAGA